MSRERTGITRPDADARARAMLADRTAPQLVEMLLEAERLVDDPDTAPGDRTARNRVRLWVIDEIERRYEVDAAMTAWAADTSSTLTYVEALIAAIPLDAFR